MSNAFVIFCCIFCSMFAVIQASHTAPKIYITHNGESIKPAHIYVYESEGDSIKEVEKITTNEHGYFRAHFLRHSPEKEFELTILYKCGKIDFNCNNPCYKITILSSDFKFDQNREAIINLEDDKHDRYMLCV
ncbi:unnamed protein product [Caenorhabditis angaria]|uniref:GOLD domain-containing protein n=1 Tax=Caenorhabditis angaria TaxID=860376 RepID=A0A9P1IDW8_9PELO|nr:unnamed protein product [Caenorhabditis angaria]